MLSVLESIVNHFEDPDVYLVGIFRVDGIPIVVRCREKEKVLKIADWLDRHVKEFLDKMLKGELEDVTTKFRNVLVRVYPLTKTLSLVLVGSEDISIYKFEIDITSIRNMLG